MATDGSTVVLDGVTVSNTGDGTVEVDATEAVVSTLDLESATISGGIVNVYGLLDSTGTSAIDGAAITITGTLEATSGTLTIDPSTISNSGELLATDGSTVVLDGVTVSNTGDGTVEVDATEAVVSTLDLESATISGGIVNVYGLLDFDRHQRHRRCGHHHHRNARSDQWHADHRSQHDQQQPRAVGDAAAAPRSFSRA